MAEITGYRGKTSAIPLYDASGTIASATAPQLILPKAVTRSSVIIQNISSASMYVEVGAARASATLTSGAVSSVSITNGGFGYTKPPKVVFLGGGNNSNNQNNPSFLSAGQPDYPSPLNAATGHAVLTSGVVTSIVIDNPGSGYINAPYVQLVNDPLDPFGCASPYYNSTPSGLLLVSPGGSYVSNGSVCVTDPIAIFCATLGSAFTCKYSV